MTYAPMLLACGLVLAATASVQAATPQWDLVGDFTLARNPNGPWKYSGNHNVLHLTTTQVPGATGLQAYTNGQLGQDNTLIARNPTTLPITFRNGLVTVPPNYLLMDPEAGLTNVFWTAPATGRYQIAVVFAGLNTRENGHYVGIDLHGQAVRVLGNVTVFPGIAAQRSFTLHLDKGQILNFSVVSGTNAANQETGLSVHITQLSTP